MNFPLFFDSPGFLGRDFFSQNHRENGGTLGMVPINTHLYKVHMGLIIKGPPSQGYHHFLYDKMNSQLMGPEPIVINGVMGPL